MEEHLKIIKPFVENILNAIEDGVYITDKEGTTLYVNETYEKLTGLKSEDLLGQNVRVLQGKGVFDEVVNPMVVETRTPVTGVQVLKGGKRVVLRGSPVFDRNNELALVITLVRDVTIIGQMREQIIEHKKLISIYLKFLSCPKPL